MDIWQTPTLEEIDMNAEIGGYEPDSPDERGDDPLFVETLTSEPRPA
jgi:hypothetical protein